MRILVLVAATAVPFVAPAIAAFLIWLAWKATGNRAR
jgi:hypothetical protein